MNRRISSSVEILRPHSPPRDRATSAPPLLRVSSQPPSPQQSPLPFSLSSGSLPRSVLGWSSSRTTPSPSHPFPDSPLSWLRSLTPTTFQRTIAGQLYQVPQHLAFAASPSIHSSSSNSSNPERHTFPGPPSSSPAPVNSRPAFSPVPYDQDGTHVRLYVQDLISIDALLPAALSHSSNTKGDAQTPSSTSSEPEEEVVDSWSAAADRIIRWLDANPQPAVPAADAPPAQPLPDQENDDSDVDPWTSGHPFSPSWTLRLPRLWQLLPHEQPIHHQPPTYVVASDATLMQLGVSAPGLNVCVLHFGLSIYLQEALALVIAAIAAPAATLLLCDNQALIFATRTGHGHAIPWALCAALLYTFALKDLKIKWVPTQTNPADAPSRFSAALTAQSLAGYFVRTFGRSLPVVGL